MDRRKFLKLSGLLSAFALLGVRAEVETRPIDKPRSEGPPTCWGEQVQWIKATLNGEEYWIPTYQ
jgi:hypothetical protein